MGSSSADDPAGSVVHDERGNVVYKWKKDPRTADTMMQMLRPDELSLLQEVAEAADRQYFYDRSR